MDELKACPFCNGEATFQAKNMHGLTTIICKQCGVETPWGNPEELVAAWNLRAEPENKPLTLEQLRLMDCDWVWIERIGKCGELPKSVLKYINGYGYVLGKHQKVKICDICLFFEDYEKTWFAYARKPENKPQQLCGENENFIQNKFGYCFYTLDFSPLIYNLYVHLQYRHHGHSRTLLQFAIREIRKSGYEGEIRIQAKPREDSIGQVDLIKYYQSMGLVIYEAHKPEEEK